MTSAASTRVEPRPDKPDPVARSVPQDLRAQTACVRSTRKLVHERRDKAWLDLDVVVQNQNAVRTKVQSTTNPDITAPGKAEILFAADEYDFSESLADSVFGPVSRAAVDDDDRERLVLDIPKRMEAAERVVAPVPREDDDRYVVDALDRSGPRADERTVRGHERELHLPVAAHKAARGAGADVRQGVDAVSS